MKSSAIVCAIATVALAASSLSQAQNRDEYRRGQDPRQDSRSQVVLVQPATVHYFNARGPEFRRGGRIPQGYRGQAYVVDNWRAHRLQAPPRGQHWVQVGPDYVLVAIATGVITQLILAQ